VFARRALGAEHREAQLERSQLARREAHRAQEVIGVHGGAAGADVDLHVGDEAARITESVGERLEVARERGRVHSQLRGDLVPPVLAPVGELGDHVEHATQLGGGGMGRHAAPFPEWTRKVSAAA
jgi:hypothetical protein